MSGALRGEVYISPVEHVPADGSMIDPATARFAATWDNDFAAPLESAELDGAAAAIAWGRDRAAIVLIRLGNRGDTYFSAGVINPEDDEGPTPAWPPDGPPPGGWWQPPTCPTLEEIDAVRSEVATGERSADDAAAWALERIRPTLGSGGSDEILYALEELASQGSIDRASPSKIYLHPEER